MSDAKPPDNASDIARIIRNVMDRSTPVLMTGINPYQHDIPSDFRAVIDVAQRAMQHTVQSYWNGNAYLDYVLKSDFTAMRNLRRAHAKTTATTKRSW